MKYLLCIPLLLACSSAYACLTCNKAVREGIYNSMFLPDLLTMLSPFMVLAVLIAVSSRLATKRYNTRVAMHPGQRARTPIPLTAAATVLGIGIGGFIDGIVLHQILQWHQMLSNRISTDNVVNKSVNMFWDGIFHAFTLTTTIIGIYLLWKLLKRRNINRSGWLLAGGMSIGWGLFNITEGIINHHLLELHHVRENTFNSGLWDYGFLGFSLLLLFSGWGLYRKGKQQGLVPE